MIIPFLFNIMFIDLKTSSRFSIWLIVLAEYIRSTFPFLLKIFLAVEIFQYFA